jgi:hypothetical protein
VLGQETTRVTDHDDDETIRVPQKRDLDDAPRQPIFHARHNFLTRIRAGSSSFIVRE